MENFNNSILLQYQLMTINNLPTLTDKDHDVDLWYDLLNSWRKIQKITSDEEMFNWCMMKVQGEGATNLREAQRNRENNLLRESDYLSLEEIKEVLLETYKLKEDPEDIINKLKDMKIGTKDDIKFFNKQYKNLYNKLDEDNKCRITTSDYLDAIINKNHAWKNVKAEHKRRKFSISEAMETVEFYDNIEIELKNKTRNGNTSNSNSKGNNNGNPNKENINKYKVQFCKFCHETGHTKADCNAFVQFQYLKYKNTIPQFDNGYQNFNNNFNNYNNPNNQNSYGMNKFNSTN
eukprot:jgi/Orpsp1_1/1191916/evm.model.d7180000089354.1